MYIKKIELINFKGIKKFESDFSGNVYFITGENELGKSSILEAIVRLLTGNREAVLQNGEEKGNATIEIGEYKVDWRFTEKNPRGTITITSPDGMKSENVSMLQKIFCYQDFDAQEFAQWSETADGRRKQVNLVKNLLPTKVQTRLAEIETENTKLYDKRKDENSSLKTYKTLEETARKNLPNNFENYAQPLDVSQLLETQKQETQLEERYKTALQKKAERTKQIDEIPGRKEAAEATKKHHLDTAKRIIDEAEKVYQKAKETYAAELKTADINYAETLKTIETEKTDFEAKLKNATDFIASYEKANTGETVAQKLEKATQHNENHKKVTAYSEAKKNREAAQKKVEATEKTMTDLATEKERLILESKLPIDGLSFTDDGLELKGVPFAQGKVSDSQIMEVATALIIASNPTTKVFRIARGESLGATKLKALVDLAKKNGYQGFIEEVRREQNELRVEEYTEK